MLNSSVHAASTAASTTGRYSGRQPAITAFTATFSTVHSTRSGGIDRDDVVGRARRAVEHAQHPLDGRRHDGQPVGPAALEHRLLLVLGVAELEPRATGCSGVIAANARGASAMLGSCVREPQPGREVGQVGAEVGRCR